MCQVSVYVEDNNGNQDGTLGEALLCIRRVWRPLGAQVIIFVVPASNWLATPMILTSTPKAQRLQHLQPVEHLPPGMPWGYLSHACAFRPVTCPSPLLPGR